MKSSYELAMERLNKTAPATKLSAKQKAEIAELESRCKAKIAECEIATRGEMTQAAAAGEREKVAELEQRLVNDRKKLQAELEEKKEAVRNKSAG
jgi:hypothetical protein